ncbi:winged helix domain-containing protein [Mesorhizobium sp. RIZ17]|uniref:winged helix domain-containing protein n=1 Tax=Mesorhizobium sp. RIZ17 TaxID=3132743 RepID=UPI003DA7B1BF
MDGIAGDLSPTNTLSVTKPRKSTITVRVEPDGRTVKLDGRAGWMLSKLIEAGKRGLTTLDLPTGVRVSHYILLLRKAGFVISSPLERHGGAFPSSHSRYRLETAVSVVEDMAVAA